MENFAQPTIEGMGKVVLKMTFSKKLLILNNVLYVPKVRIRNNLVFHSMLNKFGFRMIFNQIKLFFLDLLECM